MGKKIKKLPVSYCNESALWKGYELVKENGFLSTNMIIEIHGIIEPSKGEIRKLPGTVLKNEATGEIIYTPPSGKEEIVSYLDNLEQYVNYLYPKG